MRNIICIIFFTLSIASIHISCIKPYVPKPIQANSNYLVVEGHITPDGSSQYITLSRTVPLSSKTGLKPEAGANVTILTDDPNVSFRASDLGDGRYFMQFYSAGSAKFLRLRIITSDGKTYESDQVPIKNSPPIDSVYYRVQDKGVQIYADSHDPSNTTKYYRWTYGETYIIHSAFSSSYRYDPISNNILFRTPQFQIYECWRSDSSSTIVLNSSERLVKDEITTNPITFIDAASEKFSDRYSILVTQFAMTADEYKYYTQIKKITEQLGSIFDAQPSEITGNIHCVTNPAEPVVGFISAGYTAQARIFVDSRKLPAWGSQKPYPDCQLDTLYYNNPVTKVNDVVAYINTGQQIPVFPVQPPGGAIQGFAASGPECVDCTLRGTNVRPAYWTDK